MSTLNREISLPPLSSYFDDERSVSGEDLKGITLPNKGAMEPTTVTCTCPGPVELLRRLVGVGGSKRDLKVVTAAGEDLQIPPTPTRKVSSISKSGWESPAMVIPISDFEPTAPGLIPPNPPAFGGKNKDKPPTMIVCSKKKIMADMSSKTASTSNMEDSFQASNHTSSSHHQDGSAVWQREDVQAMFPEPSETSSVSSISVLGKMESKLFGNGPEDGSGRPPQARAASAANVAASASSSVAAAAAPPTPKKEVEVPPPLAPYQPPQEYTAPAPHHQEFTVQSPGKDELSGSDDDVISERKIDSPPTPAKRRFSSSSYNPHNLNSSGHVRRSNGGSVSGETRTTAEDESSHTYSQSQKDDSLMVPRLLSGEEKSTTSSRRSRKSSSSGSSSKGYLTRDGLPKGMTAKNQGSRRSLERPVAMPGSQRVLTKKKAPPSTRRTHASLLDNNTGGVASCPTIVEGRRLLVSTSNKGSSSKKALLAETTTTAVPVVVAAADSANPLTPEEDVHNLFMWQILRQESIGIMDAQYMSKNGFSFTTSISTPDNKPTTHYYRKKNDVVMTTEA